MYANLRDISRALGLHETHLQTLKARRPDTFPKPMHTDSNTALYSPEQVTAFYIAYKLQLQNKG